jgi:hypothetical protein
MMSTRIEIPHDALGRNRARTSVAGASLGNGAGHHFQQQKYVIDRPGAFTLGQVRCPLCQILTTDTTWLPPALYPSRLGFLIVQKENAHLAKSERHLPVKQDPDKPKKAGVRLMGESESTVSQTVKTCW